WYMRQYPNARFYGANPTSDSMSAPVIIVGSANYDKVAPYVARDYVKRTYRQVWWPDQSYFNQTPLSMWRTFTNPDKLKEIFQIVFYRRYPDSDGIDGYRDLTKWPNRHEFEMWVRRDIAADIWDLGVTPTLAGGTSNEALARANEIDLYANVIFNDLYDGLSLNAPRTLDMGVDGSRYIADSGNHRIVVLDPQGALMQTIGSYCNLAEGAASGCVDPDGSGPLELGDGQFFEPWGVAVDQTGTLYVADTWNGRIQTFDSNGEFKGKWGFFNTTNGELGDANALFGPRGIAVDRDGNVLVADTGNKRILHYTPDGQLITQIGGGGVIAGHFEEPTDVAVDPTDGSIFVADAWNRRIQKFAPDLTFMAEWAVPSWESQDRFDKPYLAVDNNGSVYASDPAMFRVFVFNSAGEITASIGNYGTEANHFVRPTGLALDQQTNELLVADADNNRIMQFPPILP
ncbi:MAG: NHL repeat-containing protein, partial [Caldilineaceae bacterium]|nr:NHL repeat-containing protein [Caldilineaceae bacterium]